MYVGSYIWSTPQVSPGSGLIFPRGLLETVQESSSPLSSRFNVSVKGSLPGGSNIAFVIGLSDVVFVFGFAMVSG